MQIVIDIPDEDYNFIKDLQFYSSGRRSGKTIEKNIINGIKNGTVLPKGHGRLIDGDVLYKLFEQDNFIWEADSYILTAPTIIEADGVKNEPAIL